MGIKTKMFEEKKIISISQFPLKQSQINREKQCIVNVDQKKMTDRQKTVLVDFIKKNVNLILPKITNWNIRPEAQTLWRKIAEELNGMPGATKSWRQWRRSWQYVYRFARQNLPELQARESTGTLTDTQVDLLNLINLTKANNLPLDPAENDIAENVSDEDDFLEEEWLEDIDVNDKEPELGKTDKLQFNIRKLNSVPVPIEAAEISVKEKNIPIPETSRFSVARVSNSQEIINNFEPSCSRKRSNPENDYLNQRTFEMSKILSDQHFRDRKQELSCRENELKNRERELSSRERELAFRENELKRRNSDSLNRELELINREYELIFREREVIRRERELISREDGLLTLNRGLLDFEQKLALRAKEIEKLGHKIRDKMEKKMKFDSGFFENSDDDDTV